jgi:hypothetical protein
MFPSALEFSLLSLFQLFGFLLLSDLFSFDSLFFSLSSKGNFLLSLSLFPFLLCFSIGSSQFIFKSLLFSLEFCFLLCLPFLCFFHLFLHFFFLLSLNQSSLFNFSLLSLKLSCLLLFDPHLRKNLFLLHIKFFLIGLGF